MKANNLLRTNLNNEFKYIIDFTVFFTTIKLTYCDSSKLKIMLVVVSVKVMLQ